MDEVGRKKKTWGAIAFLLPIALMALAFPDLVKAPHAYMYSEDGDGLKNIYTYLYYVEHDEGHHFSGMNYPYGEVVTFTDNQPLFAWVSQKINSVLPLGDGLFTLFNLSMLIGIALGVFFCFKILRFYGVSPLMSLWGGLVITALAPQMNRIDVHFALGYLFFVPMNLYLLLRSLESGKTKYPILLALSIAAQAFIHLYFILINAVLVVSVVFVCFLRRRKNSNFTLRPILNILAGWILASVASVGLIKSWDDVVDRPLSPYGIEAYVTNLQSLFLPAKGPFYTWLKPEGIIGEGEAYLGLAAILFALALILLLYRHWRYGKNELVDRIPNSGLLIASVIAGALVFTYAAGWLNALGLKYVNDLVPQLKQFRSLGRLAWVPYFIFMIGMWVVTDHYWKRWQLRSSTYYLSLLPFAALVLWTVEAGFYFQAHTKDLLHPNLFKDTTTTDHVGEMIKEAGLEWDDFQAGFSLPLTLLGPEKLQADRMVWNMRTMMPLSFQKGLPLLDIMMSRTSVSQGMNLMEVLSSPWIEKSRFDNTSDDYLLVMCEDQHLVERERALCSKGIFLGQTGAQTWHAIKPSDLEKYDDGWMMDPGLDSVQATYLNSYNQEEGPVYAGSGSHKVSQDGEVIWKGKVPLNQVHEISFWIYLDHERTLPQVSFRKLSGEGNTLYQAEFDYENYGEVHGDWVRAHWVFDTSIPSESFEVEVKGSETWIDEVLIRPRNENIKTTSGEDVLYNNYLINEEEG